MAWRISGDGRRCGSIGGGFTLIDKFMSRFKIQTKVIVLVVPFVLSISAVGLTGLYASGLLQGRIEISNSVLQSLSGFKQVFASMSDFLMQPTQERHDRAAKDAASQLSLLAETANGLRAETDVSLLDSALNHSKTIPENIDKIWGLQQQQEAILADVEKAQAALLDMQGQIGKRSFKLVAAAKKKEKAEKKGLTSGMELDGVSVLLDTMVVDYGKVLTPEDKMKVFAKYGPDLEKAVNKVLTALPKAKVPYGKKFQKQVQALSAQIKSNDLTEPAMNKANGTLNSFRSTATMFRQIELMRQSILNLAAADVEISKADSVANKLRAIVGNNNEIRVGFAEFVANPTEAGVKKVQQSLYMYGAEVGGLSKAVKDDPFFKELPGKVQPILDGLAAHAVDLVKNSTQKTAEFAAAGKQIDETWQQLAEFADTQKVFAGTEREGANRISIGAVLVGIVIAMIAGGALVITLKGPIGQITSAMRRLAEGRLDTAITGDGRPDEIGEMARALCSRTMPWPRFPPRNMPNARG